MAKRLPDLERFKELNETLLIEGSAGRARCATYRITPEQYATLYKAQNGACAICLLPCRSGKSLAIDHDHLTGHIRGLLCQGCNVGIGCLRDSPELLSKASEYLRTSKTNPAISLRNGVTGPGRSPARKPKPTDKLSRYSAEDLWPADLRVVRRAERVEWWKARSGAGTPTSPCVGSASIEHNSSDGA